MSKLLTITIGAALVAMIGLTPVSGAAELTNPEIPGDQAAASAVDRDATILSILHEWSSFMDANGIDAADVQEGLEALSDADLAAASRASSFGEIQALFGEVGALAYETPNALGDLTQDLVFVPLPPCRVVDTRNPNGGGAFFPGQTRSFWVTDDGAPFNLTQGGFAGACGVPSVNEPPAVVLNITAANATTNGYFTVWAFGQPQPLASILNYTSNHPNANAAILPSAVNIGKEINVFSSRSTHLIIDVIGYFKRVPVEEISKIIEDRDDSSGLNLSVDNFICRTASYTPARPERIYVNGISSLEAPSGTDIEWGTRVVSSTNGGTTWTDLPNAWFMRAHSAGTGARPDTNATQASMNLGQGTTYNFALRVRTFVGSGTSGEYICSLFGQINNR
jgi:hypothetical protein